MPVGNQAHPHDWDVTSCSRKYKYDIDSLSLVPIRVIRSIVPGATLVASKKLKFIPTKKLTAHLSSWSRFAFTCGRALHSLRISFVWNVDRKRKRTVFFCKSYKTQVKVFFSVDLVL